MCSFIGSKRYKVWIWLAIDSLTKEIVGLHVGDRDRRSAPEEHRAAARKLWDSLPPVYRLFRCKCDQATEVVSGLALVKLTRTSKPN